MAKQVQIVSKKDPSLFGRDLGSFLAYDIELVLNSFLLSHSSRILPGLYLIHSALQL